MNLINTLHGYDAFSDFYDKFWGNRSLSMFPTIKESLLNRVLPGGCVLDLCCGTGQFSEKLVESGYRVTGVDSSVRMLEIAQERVRNGKFVLCDMETFRAENSFDSAVCLYDSLNHLLSADALKRVIGNMYHNLRRGGRFAFDLNTEQKYLEGWDGRFVVEEGNLCFEVVATHDEVSRLASFRGEVRNNRGQVVRIVDLKQTWFELDVVRKLLEQEGFQIYRETTGKGVELTNAEKADRVVFFAIR